MYCKDRLLNQISLNPKATNKIKMTVIYYGRTCNVTYSPPKIERCILLANVKNQ